MSSYTTLLPLDITTTATATATATAGTPESRLAIASAHIQSIRDQGLPPNPFDECFSAPRPRFASLDLEPSSTSSSASYAFGQTKRFSVRPSINPLASAAMPSHSPLYAPRSASRMWEIKRWQRANETQFLLESLRHVYALGEIAQASCELDKYLSFASRTFSDVYTTCFGSNPAEASPSQSVSELKWQSLLLESWVYVRRHQTALQQSAPVLVMPDILGLSLVSGTTSPKPSIRSSIFSRRGSLESTNDTENDDIFSHERLRQMMNEWLGECITCLSARVEKFHLGSPLVSEPLSMDSEEESGLSQSGSSRSRDSSLLTTESSRTSEDVWWIEMADDAQEPEFVHVLTKERGRSRIRTNSVADSKAEKTSGRVKQVSQSEVKAKTILTPFSLIKKACRRSRRFSHSEHLAYSSLA